MKVDEIFGDLTKHMIEGFMLHEDLANYYDFLNLHGYKRCHEYHYYHESKLYRKICRYYINHYNKLLKYDDPQSPNVIPMNWFNYERSSVDTSTKRNAVKNAIEKWVSWETETKALYQRLYNELIEIDEIASAKKVMCLICDVDNELKKATRKHLDLKSVDYDISYILFEQDKIHDKYKFRNHH